MAAKSKIEWTDATWNPVTGCTKVSEGCANCYAESMAKRLQAAGAKRYRNGFKVTCHPEVLDEPLHWKRPRRIFVSSMGDLFHEDVPDEFLWQLFDVMNEVDRHTYLILTKRIERFQAFMEKEITEHGWGPLPEHIWPGVTVESDKYLWRIEELLQIPAAKRFVSLEPLLGGMDLKLCPDPDDILACDREPNESYPVAAEPCSSGKHWVNFAAPNRNCLDWVIIGAESGAKRRECKIEWVRDAVGQCKAAGIPAFVKQLHINGKLSKNMADWPEDSRIREWPE